MRFIDDPVCRTADARRLPLQYDRGYRRFGFGLYLVELKAEKAPIGICGLIKRDALHDVDLALLSCRNFGHRATRSKPPLQ